MFNWMNRRAYHFLKVWFKMLGVILAVLAGFAGLFRLMLYIDSIWGMTGVAVVVIGVTVLIVSIIVAWIESKDPYREELEQQRRIEKSLKKDW